jgi:hypothetical protein
MPQGSYVTDDTLGKVDDEVRSDETVQYIAKGNSLDAKYQGSTTSYNNTKGWPRMVATDQRVFYKVPKVFNTKVESVEYSNLSAADLGSSGLSGTEIKLRTVRGKTYTFKADEPGDAELEEMVEFIREQISNQSGPETQSASSDTTSPSSTTASQSTTSSSDRADLHKTESCVECGESVSEGIERCPNCGYNPDAHNKWRAIHSVLAGVSFITIIGIPLAVWFYLKAKGHRKKVKAGVTG